MNALYETILYNGYGTDGFIVGKNRKTPVDSSKYYGWLQTVKYKDILKTFIKTKTMQMHNGQARGFDVFASNGKPIIKQQKSIPPDKHDNELLAELIALKFGITASSMGFTPVGFGELMYNDGTTNPLNNKTVAEIAGYGDSIIMGWYDQLTESKVFAMDDIYENLYQTIRRIDSVFEGVLDTVSFGDSLEFKGVRQLADVPFLQYSNLIPARIILLERGWQQPMEFALHQNYPNPFNPITTIEFELPEESFVTLKIYNTLGQEVATILDHEVMDAGTQEIEFDASHLSSGVYFYRIIAGRINEDESTISSFQTVKKMIVIK
ncbi:MAG: T9SS type A sorting domain-containing protein [Ignavibacteriales bacterium]|nr:T9SS type A sorting domain-containing protein [Ignavibacteriales bacterium]